MTDLLFDLYKNCRLCPRRCGADRLAGEKGFCGETAQLRAARAALHFWEEPCLTGGTDDTSASGCSPAVSSSRSAGAASGAVFFTGCSLRCAYCQNGVLSRGEFGLPLSAEGLADCFLSLQDQGAANIDLVTPDHFLPHAAAAVKLAKERGLALPVVWNCSGYADPEVLRYLEGIVDIYLADFKYLDKTLAKDLSSAPDYPEYAKAALAEMVRQTGPCIFTAGAVETAAEGPLPGGRLMRGVIVRHLVLPGHIRASADVLTYLHETYGDRILLSIMAQYTPPAGGTSDSTSSAVSAAPSSGTASAVSAAPLSSTAPADRLRETAVFQKYPELLRPLTRREYGRITDAALSLGIENAYVQDLHTAKDSFIPVFDGTGLPGA